MYLDIEEFQRTRHDTRDIKALLSLAVGRPSIDKLTYLMDEFYASKGRTIFIAIDNGEINAIIGIDYAHKPHGFITHLAVRSEARRRGIASKLIEYATSILELAGIEAETDQDAVDFYNACGFEIREIRSQYTGVRRFRCVKDLTSSAFIR